MLEKRFVGLLINIGILPPQKTQNGDVIDTATLNFGDPLFLVAAALDPEFRLNWLNVEHDDTIKVTITCKAKLHTLMFFYSFFSTSVMFITMLISFMQRSLSLPNIVVHQKLMFIILRNDYSTFSTFYSTNPAVNLILRYFKQYYSITGRFSPSVCLK